MRILVNDYAGHPFQFELSAELAARGHEVHHVYCSSIVDELRYGWQSVRVARQVRPDRLLTSNVPILSLLVVWLWALTTRTRWVLWLQDIQSGIAEMVIGRRSPAVRVLGALTRPTWAARPASHSHICAPPAPYRDEIYKRFGRDLDTVANGGGEFGVDWATVHQCVVDWVSRALRYTRFGVPSVSCSRACSGWVRLLMAGDIIRMRNDIVHVVEPPTGGAPTVAMQLAMWEAAAGYAVTLVGHPESSVFRDSLPTVSYRPADLTLGANLRASRHVLREAIATAGLVHFHSSRAALVGRMMNIRARRRNIFTPHAWSWHAVPQLARQPVIAAERLLARTVDVIHVLSHTEAAEAETVLKVGDDRIALIANGVDLQRFRWAPRRHTRRDIIRLLTVGRLCPQKGQDLLLDAVSQASPTMRYEIVLAGSGPAGTRLREQAKQLPSHVEVRFVGEIADPAPLYHDADLVVFPSRWEGQSLALLEAVASGAAVLTTNVSGTESLVGAVATCEPRVPDLVAELARLEDPAKRESLSQATRAYLSDIDEQSARVRHLDLKARLL